MFLRREFVLLASLPEANVARLCRRFGITRATGYKWIGRYRDGGTDALADRTRRPHTSPTRTPPEIETDVVRKAIADKYAGKAELVDQFIKADEQRRDSLTELQTLQQHLNEAGKLIGPLMKEGKRDEAAPLIERTAQLKEQIKTIEEAVGQHEEDFNEVMLEIPNIPHESVPVGHTPEENEVVFEWGELPSFDFEAKPHWELAEQHGRINFERGAEVTGAGFPLYIGKGARLQRALI